MKAYTATYEGKDGKGELNMTVGGDNFTQAARKAENVANELERGELISLVLTDDVIL